MKFNEISNNGKTRLLLLIEQMRSGALEGLVDCVLYSNVLSFMTITTEIETPEYTYI